MRFFLFTLLFISFLGIGIFGFSVMGEGHMDCIATAVQGKMCPEASGSLGFINFHLNAAKFFSTAVLGQSFVAVFAVLLAGLACAKILHEPYEPSPFLTYRLPQFLLRPAALPKENFFSWLTLHEKRDPMFAPAFSA